MKTLILYAARLILMTPGATAQQPDKGSPGVVITNPIELPIKK
jgi:hypothetical protein